MLNESLKGIFEGEFTEVILNCIESSLPKDSNATVVDVRNNPKYNGIDCIVLLDSEELCNEISKNIQNGYHMVTLKNNRNDLEATVLAVIPSDYKQHHKDIKYTIKRIV